jgi:hypothetical protein
MRGTAHEYVWLDHAPCPPALAAAAVTAAARAAATPDSDLGERYGAAREAVTGQEAAGGSAEPLGGHCQDVTAWWVMDAKSEVMIHGFEITCSQQLIACYASTTGFAVYHCMHIQLAASSEWAPAFIEYI